MDSSSKEKSLSACFDEAFAAFNEVSNCVLPTNNSDVQYKVKKCMNLLEDITRMVSAADMFSANETVSELPTEHLKFMLLPALLGMLVLKLTNGERRDIVLTAEVYFKDFLRRCNNYSLTNVQLSDDKEESDVGASTTATGYSVDMMSMARRRAAKIQQYHRQKQLEVDLQNLSELVKSNRADEEVQRKYYLLLIKTYIDKSVEELDCLQSEKNILSHMSANKPENFGTELGLQVKKTYKSKPLTAVIITKDDMQKKVFGAGYPSVPTMTVQELCEQRVKEGVWSLPGDKNTGALQDMATNEELKKIQAQQDDVEQELAIERDDEDFLERARRMDEYKDTHKRGWGNRYNRG